MKKILLILIGLPALVYSQNRIVFNNNSYMVIDNAANLVIDNQLPNALSTLGTGGNIVSENEMDVVKWNIGSNTGNYVIPWTTQSGIKIPLSITKTTAGVGTTASFTLSTWETTDVADMNLPWPTMVTNMNLPSAANGSLFAVDRFWHINALSYTAKPAIELVMNYDPASTEIGINNTITETNLLAQRFNTTLGNWETYKLFGTNDAINDRVTGIVVPSADFFENWILVDKTNPLPVTLVSFDVNCEEHGVVLNWTTQTEINNDFFVIEKSIDAINFFDLTTIQGAGNSNTLLNYSYTDDSYISGIAYYRLKQFDFNGQYEYFNIEAINCKLTDNGFYTYPNPTNGVFQLQFNTPLKENAQLEIYDLRGRIVLSKVLQKDINSYSIDLSTHNNAVYFLKLQCNNTIKNIKIIKQ